MDEYDVVVIGAGPAGYVAAIRCAQLGLKTACVEEWINKQGKPALGGTCLNVGCIPSKALLDSSEHYQNILHDTQKHGISFGDLKLDVPAMIQRKDKIVTTLTAGVEGLFKKNKVTWLQGHGSLQTNMQVIVKGHDGKENTVSAQHIILATGSTPRYLKSIPVDQKDIVDSTAALNFDEVPKRLGIIGAGVIGVELGSGVAAFGFRGCVAGGTGSVPVFCGRTDRTRSPSRVQATGSGHSLGGAGHVGDTRAGRCRCRLSGHKRRTYGASR